MNEEKIKEIVYRNYDEGYHCAESIVNAIHELYPEKPEMICKAASGFCGGIGGCKEDVCGALSGGIIALGFIFGRQKGGDVISRLLFLSAEFRLLFIEKFKSTVCKDVIKNLEQMPEFNGCKDLTAHSTWILYNLIKNNN